MTKPLGYTGSELLNSHFAQPNEIIGSVLQEGSLTLIWGGRGSGKTFVVGKAGYAMSTGSRFFKWQSKQKKVLCIDCEMRDAILQHRLRLTHYGERLEGLENFRIITRDLMGDRPWNLITEEGFKLLRTNLSDAEVVIFDNYNNLTSETQTFKTDLQQWKAWEGILSWLRQRNIAVILVHHGNKAGEQSGTQQRENFMDTVIRIKQNKSCEDSLAMEFEFTKSRNYFGPDIESLFLEMTNHRDSVSWSWKSLKDQRLCALQDLLSTGVPKSRIPEALGISFAEFQKLLKLQKEQDPQPLQEQDDHPF